MRCPTDSGSLSMTPERQATFRHEVLATGTVDYTGLKGVTALGTRDAWVAFARKERSGALRSAPGQPITWKAGDGCAPCVCFRCELCRARERLDG